MNIDKRGQGQGAGRPSLQVKRVDITLTENQIAWLKKRDNASETIRKMLEEKMDEPSEVARNQQSWNTGIQKEIL